MREFSDILKTGAENEFCESVKRRFFEFFQSIKKGIRPTPATHSKKHSLTKQTFVKNPPQGN